MSSAPHDHGDGLTVNERRVRLLDALGDDAEYDGVAVNAGPWPHGSDDPTATKQLRARYSGEMYRRFRALKGAIIEGVVRRDAFGLRADEGRGTPVSFAALTEDEQDLVGNLGGSIDIDPPTQGEFRFTGDDKKVDAFLSWLDEQTNRGILESDLRDRTASAAEQWQNAYLRDAYRKGATHADHALFDSGIIDDNERIAGDVFSAPKHADSAGLIYTRAYRELDGVTSAMGQAMSRELADGLSQGENPRKIARRLNGRVDGIGLHRGRLIARTEVIRAHNEAAINRYQDVSSRVSGVRILAEFATAGDARVCPICASFEGVTIGMERARGLIPVHPNCRCTWLPVRSSQDSTPPRSPLHDAIEQADAENAKLTGGDPRLYADAIEENTPLKASFGSFSDAEQGRLAAQLIADLDAEDALDDLARQTGGRGSRNALRIQSGESPGSAGGHFSAAETAAGKVEPKIVLDRDVFGRNSDEWVEAARDGFISADPSKVDRHIFLHEFEHARHFAHVADEFEDTDDLFEWWKGATYKSPRNYNFDAAERELIESEVSEYATKDPYELVAEVNAARRQGKEFDTEILEMVDSFRGPLATPSEGEFVGNVSRLISWALSRLRMSDNSGPNVRQFEDPPLDLDGENEAVRDAFETLATAGREDE